MTSVGSLAPYITPPPRARLRSKEHLALLLTLVFLVLCYVYTTQASSVRSQSAVAAQQPSSSWSLAPDSSSSSSSSNSALASDQRPPSLQNAPALGDLDTSGNPLHVNNGAPHPADEVVGGASGSADSANSNSLSNAEIPIHLMGFDDDDDDDDDMFATAGDYDDEESTVAPPRVWPDVLTPESPRAIIVESSLVHNLLPLIIHFAAVLGPSWGIMLFILKENWIEPQSPAFQRLKASGHIEVRFLPAGTSLADSKSVSTFLTSSWIWEQVLQAHRVLLFQTDSIICSKSETAVEDYFEYDFVGAPISPVYGQGYNGGLSIRNPRLFWHIVQETDFATSAQQFEDQFFYNELQKRGAALPDQMVAKTFAVETIYYETPLGYHQPQRWQPAHLESIVDWCPEVTMLIGRRAH